VKNSLIEDVSRLSYCVCWGRDVVGAETTQSGDNKLQYQLLAELEAALRKREAGAKIFTLNARPPSVPLNRMAGGGREAVF